MKMADPSDDDMPDEVDFSAAERGRFAGRISQDAMVVLLEPDVKEVFPDSDSVNAALRIVIRAGVLAARQQSDKDRKAS